MATVQRPSSMSKRFAKFTNSTAGLDLTLRFVHALVIVAAEVSPDVDVVKTSLLANMQIGLARRYLRFFCFLDCFNGVYDLLTGSDKSPGALPVLFDLVESTCLGLYIFIENSTMLHDMNLWLVPWYNPVLVEANKFWFYAICASIARTLYTLLTKPSSKPKRTNGKKKASAEKVVVAVAPGQSDLALLRKLVVDCLDLVLPASFIGWIPLQDVTIGGAMIVSTLLTWPDMWAKIE